MLASLRALVSRIRGVFTGRRLDSDFEQELESHRSLLTEENVRVGMAPEEARRVARLKLGGAAQLRELHHDQRTLPWLESLWQDVRFAARMLRKNPGFNAVAILTLALGIGANTAIFSLADALILHPLPVREPAQLLVLERADPGYAASLSFSYSCYSALRDNQQCLSGLAASFSPQLNVRVAEEATRVLGSYVSGNYFELLGVKTFLGRALTPEDDRSEADPAALISYAFWQTHLLGDTSAVGRNIYVEGVPVTIVGVLPPQFLGIDVGKRSDVFVPAALITRTMPEAHVLNRDNFNLWELIGRRKIGITAAQATANLQVVWANVLAGLGHQNDKEQIYTESAATGLSPVGGLRGQYALSITVLMVVVGFVLLIASGNVANLLLARGSARQREFGIRRALGAGSWRLARQILIENCLLGLLGGASGLWFGFLVGSALVDLLSTTRFPVFLSVQLDWRVLAFTFMATVLTIFVSGLVPAFRVLALGSPEALRGGASPTTTSHQTGINRVLVTAQVGFSVLLLVGTGLFVRTLQELYSLDLGFDAHHLLTFQFDWGRNTLSGTALVSAIQGASERIGAIPGVQAVGFSNDTPLWGSNFTIAAQIEGQPPRGDAICWLNGVTPGYFAALRTPLLAGRAFVTQDGAATHRVTIVSEGFARAFFPHANPIGQHISISIDGNSPFEIVGVVRDARYSYLLPRPAPREVYIPLSQWANMPSMLAMEVRISGTATPGLIRAISDELGPINDYATITVAPMQALLNDAVQQQRTMAVLSVGFGLLALGLTNIGLFGLLTYTVNRKLREIGIRLALGAQPEGILRKVIWDGLAMVLTGIGLGVVASLALSRFVVSLLFEVKPTDPIAFIGASILLLLVALLGCYIPARRAMRVDPMVALRHE